MFAVRAFAIIIGVVAVAGLLVFLRSQDPVRRAGFLKRSGMIIMALSAGVFGLLVVGETFEDPGGWEAVGLVALWLVPLAFLAAIGWFRPAWAIPVLTALTAATVALVAWRALDEGVRDLEDRVGPVTAIVLFVVMVGAAALGHNRTRVAGILLLALGVAPIAIWGIATGDLRMGTSLMVASTPACITGVLYLLSSMFWVRAMSHGTAHPSPV